MIRPSIRCARLVISLIADCRPLAQKWVRTDDNQLAVVGLAPIATSLVHPTINSGIMHPGSRVPASIFETLFFFFF